MWEGGGEQSGPYKFNKARSVRRYANRTVDYTSNGEREGDRDRDREEEKKREVNTCGAEVDYIATINVPDGKVSYRKSGLA